MSNVSSTTTAITANTALPLESKRSPVQNGDHTFIVLATKFAPYLDRFFRSFPELNQANVHIIDASEAHEVWKNPSDDKKLHQTQYHHDYLSEIVDSTLLSARKEEKEEEKDVETDSAIVKRAQMSREATQEAALAEIPSFPDLKNSQRHLFIIQDEKLEQDPNPLAREDVEYKGLYSAVQNTKGFPKTFSFMYLNQNDGELSYHPLSMDIPTAQPSGDKMGVSVGAEGKKLSFTLTPDHSKLQRINLNDPNGGLEQLNYYTRMLIAQTEKYDGWVFKDLSKNQQSRFNSKHRANAKRKYACNAIDKFDVMRCFADENMGVAEIAQKLKLKPQRVYEFIAHQAFGNFDNASLCRVDNRVYSLDQDQISGMFNYLQGSGLKPPARFLKCHIMKLAYDLYGIKIDLATAARILEKEELNFRKISSSYEEPGEVAECRRIIAASDSSDFDDFQSILDTAFAAHVEKTFNPDDVKTSSKVKPCYMVGPRLHEGIFYVLDNPQAGSPQALLSLIINDRRNPRENIRAFEEAFRNPFSVNHYRLAQVRDILYTAFTRSPDSEEGKALRDPAQFDLFIRHLERSSNSITFKSNLDYLETQVKLKPLEQPVKAEFRLSTDYDEEGELRELDLTDQEKDEFAKANSAEEKAAAQEAVKEAKAAAETKTNEEAKEGGISIAEAELELDLAANNSRIMDVSSTAIRAEIDLSTLAIHRIYYEAQELADRKLLNPQRLNRIVAKYEPKSQYFNDMNEVREFANELGLKLRKKEPLTPVCELDSCPKIMQDEIYPYVRDDLFEAAGIPLGKSLSGDFRLDQEEDLLHCLMEGKYDEIKSLRNAEKQYLIESFLMLNDGGFFCKAIRDKKLYDSLMTNLNAIKTGRDRAGDYQSLRKANTAADSNEDYEPFTTVAPNAVKAEVKPKQPPEAVVEMIRAIAPDVKRGKFRYPDLHRAAIDFLGFKPGRTEEEIGIDVVRLIEFCLKYGIVLAETFSGGSRVKSEFEPGSIAEGLCWHIQPSSPKTSKTTERENNSEPLHQDAACHNAKANDFPDPTPVMPRSREAPADEQCLSRATLMAMLLISNPQVVNDLTESERILIAEYVFNQGAETEFGSALRNQDLFTTFCTNLRRINQSVSMNGTYPDFNDLFSKFNEGEIQAAQIIEQLGLTKKSEEEEEESPVPIPQAPTIAKINDDNRDAFDAEVMRDFQRGTLTYKRMNTIVALHSPDGEGYKSQAPLIAIANRLGIRPNRAVKTITAKARPSKNTEKLKIPKDKRQSIEDQARSLSRKGLLTAGRLNRIIYDEIGSSYIELSDAQAYGKSKLRLEMRPLSENELDVKVFDDVASGGYENHEGVKEMLVAAGVNPKADFGVRIPSEPEAALEKLALQNDHDIKFMTPPQKAKFLRRVFHDVVEDPSHILRNQGNLNRLIDNVSKLPNEDPDPW